jgi:hypothetical protein
MNVRETTLPPLRHRVQVRLAPAAAFELFTAQIARWGRFAITPVSVRTLPT